MTSAPDMTEACAPKSDQVENWRAIPGYVGLYEVSDLGRVRSIDRVLPRRWRGRLLAPISMPSGYRVATLWRDGKQRTWLVHRLVLLAFVGESPAGHEALHLNGDNSNNALGNLAWGTHSENQFNQVAHGTHPNAAKTACPQGHPYNESNTYWYPGKPHRMCRTCRREYQKEYHKEYQRKRRVAARMAKESAA